MKRIIALLMILTLLLCGCGKTEAPTEPATLPPEPTAGWVT